MNTIFTMNIGNTNTQYARCDDGKIAETQSCPTNSLTADIIPDDIPVAVASVVPDKNLIFKGKDVFFISPENKTPVDFSEVDLKSIGADRIANATALAKFAKLPAICIDCGTALTIEAVNKDFTFAGGIITPGRKLWRKSLHNYTALLPYIETYNTKRPSVLGKTTENAIVAGCDVGILEMAKGLIAKFKNELGDPNCQVIATGGDAEFFASNVLEISQGGADFTLRGIAAIYYENQY